MIFFAYHSAIIYTYYNMYLNPAPWTNDVSFCIFITLDHCLFYDGKIVPQTHLLWFNHRAQCPLWKKLNSPKLDSRLCLVIQALTGLRHLCLHIPVIHLTMKDNCVVMYMASFCQWKENKLLRQRFLTDAQLNYVPAVFEPNKMGSHSQSQQTIQYGLLSQCVNIQNVVLFSSCRKKLHASNKCIFLAHSRRLTNLIHGFDSLTVWQ